MMPTLLIVIIVLALIFDYINGFHDAANSIATIVSTKVLTPFQAVVWAAVFNFAAFFIFKDHGVANTIAKTVKEDFITLPVIISGLLAAISWNLLTWWFGIPSSSSHTLIGGFAGAAIAHAGMMSVNPEPVLKTVAFIVLAPMIGMLAAFIISLWFIHSFRKSIYPKIISVSIIIAVIICLSMVIVTETSRIIGLKTIPANDSNGVLITDVFHNSPAWKMGLRKGDILLKIDDYPIQDKITLDNVLMQHKLNEKVTYTVLREDQNKEINNIFHTQHESRFWDITFYGENFKWILLSLIVI